MRLLFASLGVALAVLLGPPAFAAQGQPGWADPQRPVTANLTTACSTGTGCAATAVDVISLTSGYSVCSASVAGTFVGTLSFEQSIAGLNFSAAYLTPNSGSSAVATTSSAFYGTITVLGATWFQVRMSAYTSGTANVAVNCVPATRPFGVVQ